LDDLAVGYNRSDQFVIASQHPLLMQLSARLLHLPPSPPLAMIPPSFQLS